MQRYMVQPGDTAWSIAHRFGGASARWGELVASNPHKPRSRDGNFINLTAGEIISLPASWPPIHGRWSDDAAGEYVPDVQPLVTSGATELVKWIDVPKGSWDYPGRYTSDLRYFDTANNHAPNKEWWSDRAWDMWLDMADAVKADPEALLAASYSESIGLAPWRVGGFVTDPKTGKRRPIAWGLFQITSAQNRNAGVSDAEHKAWLDQRYVPHTAEQQIPFLRRYWEALNARYRKGAGFAGFSAGALYGYNFMPGHVRSGADSVLLVSRRPEDADPKLPQLFWPDGYKANKELDADADGRITIGDMGALVRRAQGTGLFALARAQLNLARARRAAGGVPIGPPPPPPQLPTKPTPTGMNAGNTRSSSGGVGLGPLVAIFFGVWALTRKGRRSR